MRVMSDIKAMQDMYNVGAREGYEDPKIMRRSVDYIGTIVDCSQSYLDNLGYTKDEVVGISLYEHTAPRSKGNLHANMEKLEARAPRQVQDMDAPKGREPVSDAPLARPMRLIRTGWWWAGPSPSNCLTNDVHTAALFYPWIRFFFCPASIQWWSCPMHPESPAWA